jgi:two-component system sensor histidine kinase AlgZ
MNHAQPPRPGNPPFLAREAFYWLTLVTPVITMLIAQDGGSAPTLERAAGCLLSTWLCAVVAGLALHLAMNGVAPRALASSQPRAVAIVILALTGVATVTAVSAVLLPRLAWLDPNLAGPQAPFIARALAVGLVYVSAARLYTWLSSRARREAERARESEERALRARLAALQAQLNPHFLFNTLNAIASLIPTDPELAESTVERLAGVLQYSIASSSRAAVTVGEELDAVRDYLEIAQARFGDRLRTRIDVDASLRAQSLPPMMLQPLVENAVLHGFSDQARGGEIAVSGRRDRKDVVLTVADDGVGPGKSTRKGNDSGLRNLRERLALTYGEGARFDVREREGGGFECELRVPCTATP